MPLYEYVCAFCQHREEHLTPLEDRDKVRECERCGSASDRVKVSRTSFVLKGSGWYKDGYQKKG